MLNRLLVDRMEVTSMSLPVLFARILVRVRSVPMATRPKLKSAVLNLPNPSSDTSVAGWSGSLLVIESVAL